jgi:hypothetical protein
MILKRACHDLRGARTLFVHYHREGKPGPFLPCAVGKVAVRFRNPPAQAHDLLAGVEKHICYGGALFEQPPRIGAKIQDERLCSARDESVHAPGELAVGRITERFEIDVSNTIRQHRDATHSASVKGLAG